MPKDRGDVRRRMREAALALFYEKGYDVTTAAEIAARAGVTERTFFRHFPDKREVLFNENELAERLDVKISEAAPDLGALEAVIWAFQSLAPMFEENLKFAEPAHAVISRTPALQERQLAKAAAITLAISEALQRRDIEPGTANLVAATAMAVTAHGLQAWKQDPSVPLVDHFGEAHEALIAISSPARR
ncbi:AcrR family transcriptional regulator [Sphingopyxis panaciterrae]|nr:AcrR family transcriptional regulator [Sphingopyxis panaciterrae]